MDTTVNAAIAQSVGGVVLATLLVFACGGCSKSGNENSSGTDQLRPLTLAQLGLTVDAPAGSKAEGNSITGPGDFSALVKATQDLDPKNPAEAKTHATSYHSASGGSVEEFESRKLSSGWIVTFRTDGRGRSQYYVDARHRMDGKSYTCGGSTSTKADQKRIAALCESLRRSPGALPK